jgi:GTP cyclohydrolase II
VQDTRFQALMPDPLHFLGVTKIHNFISMSDMKYNAIVSTGIKIVNRIEIPPDMVPDDAKVEITAKVFHGYNAGEAYKNIDMEDLKKTVGRDYSYNDT